MVFSEHEDEMLELDALADLHSMERDDDLDEDAIEVETITLGDVLEHGGRLHGRLVSIGCPDVGA